jgi:hypothetical protein
MKFKALSFIELEIPNEKYRDFLLQDFAVGSLYYFNEDSDVLFTGWKGTDMKGWYRFVNPNNGVVLEFFADEYKIKQRNQINGFPHPKTLNEFIADCNRVGLDLYWDQKKMDQLFDVKIYLNKEESNKYYKELLTKIEKSDVF